LRPLPASFFRRPADVVARELIGTTLISSLGERTTAGIIVEAEAYLGHDDPASHAYHGRRYDGNRALYGRPGTWYVYRSYGIHWCANLVCSPDRCGAAVLLRGVRPMEGIETIRQRRGGVPDERLTDGPGKLCQGFGITRDLLDGRPMSGSGVVVRPSSASGGLEVAATPRIGITRALDWKLRFVSGNR
jgi:DNA-3-methyladenine glycosylase